MTQVTNPYLQINESNLIDNSITEFEYVEYLPRDFNNMNKDGQHIFETTVKTKMYFFYHIKHFLKSEENYKLMQMLITITMT